MSTLLRTGGMLMLRRANRWNREYVDDLARTDLFRGCNRDELRLIASFVTPLRCARGRALTHEGDIGRECLVVVRGQAVVERDGVIIGHAVDGSVVGELALLGDSKREATVTAATEMDILVMSRAEFAAIRALGIRSVDTALECAAAEHRLALAQSAPKLAAAPTGG
jgi:CRP-like cAMP-binding protein